jgi:type I restriction-modification system DNA methylase subunit
MPLLNKRLIQDTVAKHKHEIGSSTKQNLQTLFKDTLNRIETGKFKKEESEKVPFLQRLFELLGYKLHENLEFEYSTSFGRSIDGVLGLQTEKGRDVEIAIEWKGIDTKSLDKGKAGETPVSQMWDYMGKVGAEIGIVGNFLEFRIYTLKTKQTDYQEYFLRELVEKEDKLDEFIFLLKKQTLLKNDSKQSLLENLISQSEAQQEQITKRFYNDYKQRRLNLFGHLVENNPEINKHILVEKAQKILDRLIFIMFCEDSTNDLLPKNILTDTYNLGKKNRSRSETKIWEQFQYLFEDIDKGRYDIQPSINAYNGGLFAEDLELNNLVIKDEVWEWFNQISEKYDFESDLNVNILGHIFEQSISDIEEIKSEIEVAEGLSLHDKQNETTINGTASVPLQKPKTSKRKKDGIYYTPEYITDYIVSETIGNWLGDQEIPLLRGGNEVDGVFPLNQIKILDPAGGSGAFPNQVHNFLSKKHEAKFKELSTDENDLFNQVQIDKSILQNNIFMVDLQPESVEIAKLSLWLKTAKKDQKLNNLDSNIKCGNSLINDPEIAGNTAFDWNKEFPEVMASGGFDVIVGNPPYVNAKNGNFTEKEKEYFYKNYETAEYQLDTYILFIEKAINLLNDGGYTGFIIPNAWLGNVFVPKIREFLLKNTEIKQIVELGNSVFEDANVDTVILIVKKCTPNPEHEIKIGHFVDQKYEFRHSIKQSLFLNNKGFVFDINLNDKNRKIIDKMEENSVLVGEILEVSAGIKEYEIGKGKPAQTIEDKNNKVYNASYKKDDSFIPEILGEHVNNFILEWKNDTWLSYGNWLAAPRHLGLFDNERIIIREIPAKDRLIVAYTKEKFAVKNSAHIGILQDKNFSMKYILGVLNSKILGWYFRYKNNEFDGLFPKIKINQFKSLPIPKATTEQQTQIADLVDQIMNLKKEMQDYLKNTFILLQAELGGQKITLNKKLEKFWTLDFAEFLGELTKQKIQISHPQKRNLITSFEADKKKILEMEQRVEIVDTKIEGLVRGLYGVK